MDETITLECELTLPRDLWDPFTALCHAQGEDPQEALARLCNNGLMVALTEITGQEEDLHADPAGHYEEDALEGLAMWLSATQGIPLHEAEGRARACLEELQG